MIHKLLRTLRKLTYEHRQKALVRLVYPHLKDGAHVLHVGCGFGHPGHALVTAASNRIRVEGVGRASGEATNSSRSRPMRASAFHGRTTPSTA
jgi:cyclopropane fatty-acyl-phospholipid synthase-like methyltransferase